MNYSNVPETRDEAKEAKSKVYRGSACEKGHHQRLRYASTGCCAICQSSDYRDMRGIHAYEDLQERRILKQEASEVWDEY